MSSVTGLTIDDFEKLPAALARNHELVDGALVDVSGNTWIHNRLREYLVKLLSLHVDQQKLGEVISEQEYDFEGNAHGPDVSFVSTEKLALLDLRRRVQRFVPDLAIEVVSQHDTFEKLMKKARRYRKCGTQEVWVFNIDGREAVVLNDQQSAILDEDQQLSTNLIPGLSIRLSDLFDRIGA
jgi:Uma2 family endonuclease